MSALHARLDTLESVDIGSPEISSRLFWGPAFNFSIVRASVLYRVPSENHVPYLRLAPASKWAVRLIPQNDLSTRAARLAYLSSRDGWSCFYCGKDLDEHTATIEHIVCTAHGGPDHADNLCLACGPCNAAVGSLPAAQKVKLAIGVRVGTIATSVFRECSGRARRQKKRIGNGKRGTI